MKKPHVFKFVLSAPFDGPTTLRTIIKCDGRPHTNSVETVANICDGLKLASSVALALTDDFEKFMAKKTESN